jgi:DNA-binding Lrp family transcriptional regulator
LDLNTVAFVFVALKTPPTLQEGEAYIRELANRVAEIQGVYEVHLISGEFDLLVKIRSKSLKTIGSLVIERLRSMPWVEKTMTNTCFETILEEGQTNLDLTLLTEELEED